MIDKRRAKLLVGIFVTIVSVDMISKWLVGHFLPIMQKGIIPYPYGGLAIFQDFFGVNFSINHQTNTGAAWGLFPNSSQTLFYVRLGIIGVLTLYTLFFNHNRKSQIPFIFIISGAVGNVLDSVFYGHVIDLFFVELWGYDFPVFNMADAFIFLGVAWLCIINFQRDQKRGRSRAIEQEMDDGFDSPPSDN